MVENGRQWLMCPACGGKTRAQVRQDTVLCNFPLYCPKCRRESLISVQDGQIVSVTTI